VPSPVASVATFGSVGVFNAFVECMGKGDLIVNEMPANFTKNDRWAYQYKFAPQIADGPVVETADGIDVEATMALDPDLCVTMTAEYAEQLQQAGLAAVVLKWDDPEDVKDAVTLMGKLLDAEGVAEDYNGYFDATVAKAAERTASLRERDERVACIYGDVESLTNPHVISEWWIEAAGGRSVTREAHEKNSLEYTLEELLAWQPEVI
jgi:iron complex transport system substrate-binding protein